MDLADLQKASAYSHLAVLFDIPAPRIARALYGSGLSYQAFTIAKRSGGTRLIEAPLGVVREMQGKLAPVLVAAYKPHDNAHGFIAHRSIASNSDPHVGKALVVNFDLENFFHSITFKRVRGLFLAKPFALSWQVANILAHACCLDGRLPAGGITSPVISNLVMSRFDKRMTSLAARHGGAYTRYADDISLSFNRPMYQIPGISARDHDGKALIGPQALQIIQAEGFTPNSSKTRAHDGGARRVVTGLVVNQKRNVKREWLHKLDATVHAIEKFGATSVASRTFPDVEETVATRMLLRKVHGRIAYLYMIRGRGDWIAAELARRFNAMHDDKLLRVPDTELLSQAHRLSRCALLVTCSNSALTGPGSWDEQGTGFVSQHGLIVTADHVIKSGAGTYPHIHVHQERKPAVTHSCEVIHSDPHRDIAVLRLRSPNSDVIRIRATHGENPDVGQKVVSLGFPSYSFGHQISRQEHEVTLVRTTSGVRKIVVTGNIHGGLSGGPVFDADSRLVGIVHRGAAGGGHANEIVAVSDIAAVLSAV